MIQSNISIISNIYIRKNPDIRKDIEYVEKITGAKRIRAIQNRYIGFEMIPLTSVQEQIASGNATCAHAKNGEMSFGPVMHDGSICWKNRCEYIACPHFNKDCGPQEITRESLSGSDIEDRQSLQDFSKKLGIIIHDDTVLFERDKNVEKLEENPKEYTAPVEQTVKEAKDTSKKYILITEPDCIISSSLESHIIYK